MTRLRQPEISSAWAQDMSAVDQKSGKLMPCTVQPPLSRWAAPQESSTRMVPKNQGGLRQCCMSDWASWKNPPLPECCCCAWLSSASASMSSSPLGPAHCGPVMRAAACSLPCARRMDAGPATHPRPEINQRTWLRLLCKLGEVCVKVAALQIVLLQGADWQRHLRRFLQARATSHHRHIHHPLMRALLALGMSALLPTASTAQDIPRGHAACASACCRSAQQSRSPAACTVPLTSIP